MDYEHFMQISVSASVLFDFKILLHTKIPSYILQPLFGIFSLILLNAKKDQLCAGIPEIRMVHCANIGEKEKKRRVNHETIRQGNKD